MRAIGDPIYERPDQANKPGALPEYGLLIRVVAPGSNGATHGLEAGDVLLAYNGRALHRKEDLQIVSSGEKPIAVVV